MSAHRLIKIAIVSVFALLAASCGAVAAIPALRHFAIALAHNPHDLPALETDARIHFEPGAKDCAREVAARLPAAIARVEAAQGRPFARDVPIGVYATPDSYVQANGLGTARVGGVAFAGRLTLSPALCEAERDRMTAILTHELSHAHLQGWLPPLAFVAIPNWFKEGLAVMVSGGGGAVDVSEVEAAAAIATGDAIAVNDEGSLFNLTAVRFEASPRREAAPASDPRARAHLAYRQAAMFTNWLRERDPNAFADFLQRIENGERFRDSFRATFGASASEKWREFVPHLPE